MSILNEHDAPDLAAADDSSPKDRFYGKDGAILIRKMLKAKPEELRRLVEKSMNTYVFPEKLRGPADRIMDHLREYGEVMSAQALCRHFPFMADVLKSVSEPKRSLSDCYKALQASAAFARINEAQVKLNELAEGSLDSIPDVLDFFASTHSELNRIASKDRFVAVDVEHGVSGALEAYEKAKAGEAAGMPLTLPFLDRALRGLQPADLFVIIGEPNAGKTWLSLMITVGLCTGNRFAFSPPTRWGIDPTDLETIRNLTNPSRVLYNSCEMMAGEVWGRIAVMVAKVNYTRYLSGDLDEEEEGRLMRALDVLKEKASGNLLITQTKDLDQVIAKAEEFGADVIVNDAFYHVAGYQEKRWERVEAAMSKMRDHSIQTGIAYVLTTQMDERVKDRAMFSQTIRQDASVIVSVRSDGVLTLSKARQAKVGESYSYLIDPAMGRYSEGPMASTRAVE